MKDIDNKASASDVKVTKHFNGTSLHRFVVPFGITSRNARRIQTELGFNPFVYGFHSFDATQSGTMWFCRSSSD